MAIDYKNLKLIEGSEANLERLKEINNLKEKTRPLIKIENLCVSEEIVPLLKNVNTFLSLNEYERASAAADKIISEYPDSASGWFAKTVAITENFLPVNMNLNCEEYNATKRKTYLNYKNNTLKMANHENIAYISECFEKYDKICAYTTAMFTYSFNFQLWVSLLSLDNFGEYKPAFVRELLAKVFIDCPNYENTAKDNPDNLILCLFYALHYINRQNYKNQCEYYGVSEDKSLLDYYKDKVITYVKLETITLSDAIKKLDLYPKQSGNIECDGYISLIYSFCDLLQIDPGNISKYYSPQTQLEIRELEKQELERIRQEQIQDEIRKQQEREQREKEEKERKAKEKKARITKLVIAAVVIIAGILCINPLIDFVEDKTGVNIRDQKEPISFNESTPTENTESAYYIISDDYNSVNVRSGAGTSYSVVKNVSSKSVRMYPTGRTEGNWIEVSSDDFGTGWVSKNIVKLIKE